jgi:hypothetical protein
MEPGENLLERASVHASQMNLYVRAAAKLVNAPLDLVAAIIVFTHVQKAVKLPLPVP